MVANRFFRKSFIAAALAFSAYFGAASAEVKPSFVDVPTFTNALEQALVLGRQSTGQVLDRLGPDVQQALRDAQEKADFKYYNFSARSQIEMLYQRAEAGGAGQGDLFLARLKDSLAPSSAAIAEDPALKFLDAVPRRPGPIVFADIATMDGDALAKKLSPAVENALTLLSEHASSRGIGHVRGVLIRNLNLETSVGSKDAARKFDSILRAANNAKGVMAAAFIAHTPPPMLQMAVQQIIEDFARNSGAFAVDPAVAKVMSGLSNELTTAEQRLVQSGPAFQAVHDAKVFPAKPPADAASEAKVARDISKAIESAPASSGGGGGGLPFPQPQANEGNRLAQKHLQYVGESFERRSPGPNTPTPPAWRQASRAPPVSRTYRVAILSPRAARGIAVGAAVKNDAGWRPLKAYWISDKTNERFGRMVVSFAPCKDNWMKFIWEMLNKCNGDPIVAVSKRLHVDSFMAANQLLWGSFNAEAQFVDGEITVLMSMNPWVFPRGLAALRAEEDRLIEKHNNLVDSYNAEVTSAAPSLFLTPGGQSITELDGFKPKLLTKPRAQPEAKQDRLRKEIAAAKDDVETAQRKQENYIAATFRNGQVPRSIVFHPAVHGRELAWAAARIDFWFNDTNRLFQEANSVAQDKETTTNMRRVLDASREGAGTWQFFEQDGTIDVEKNGTAFTLAVHAPSAANAEEDGRFAVSLFHVASGVSEDQAQHLSQGEKDIRKPLAWLQRTHPDFWRLSDFSTSLMLLRYLKSHQVQLLSFSPDNFDAQRPTPEWIYGKEVEPVITP